jgi:uncharacterized protein
VGADLKSRLNSAFIEAQKAKDVIRLSALRMVRAEVKNKEIDKKQELSDEEIIQVLNSSVKKRRESIEMFEKGGRDDLVSKEKRELAVIMEFLPEQLSEDKIREIVLKVIKNTSATSIKDMGNVMKEVMKEAKGKAEGKLVSHFVKEELDKL